MFVGIKFGYVDVNEVGLWILKCGFGGGGKIIVLCIDFNDEICIFGYEVCC